MSLFDEARNGNLKNVKYYVEKGEDINECDGRCLRWAIFYGHLEVVKYLVDHGAIISPLSIAWSRSNGNTDIYDYLNKMKRWQTLLAI